MTSVEKAYPCKDVTYPGPGIVGNFRLDAGADFLSGIEGVRAQPGGAAGGLHNLAGVPLDVAVRLPHGHDEEEPHRVDRHLQRRHRRRDAGRPSFNETMS